MDYIENGFDEILDILNKDYSKSTFTSNLHDMFNHHDEAIEAYIKPGRKFWHYDLNGNYRKLTITYVRTGVMFFVFDDEPEIEYAWFIRSFNGYSLYAAQIYPYEIEAILSKYSEYKDIDFIKMCKECKWFNCYGKINVEVIWEQT